MKKLTTLLVALTLVFAVSACWNTAKADNEESETTVEETTVESSEETEGAKETVEPTKPGTDETYPGDHYPIDDETHHGEDHHYDEDGKPDSRHDEFDYDKPGNHHDFDDETDGGITRDDYKDEDYILDDTVDQAVTDYESGDETSETKIDVPRKVNTEV
jgi:hypothetical protein